MSLPQLNENGYLPSGIHDASLDDLSERFGYSSRRQELLANLVRYLAELRQWPLAQAVLVDGSFVTDTAEPNDIDLVLVLRDDYDLRRSVSPFEYNLRSRRCVQRTFGLDLFVVRPNSVDYDRFVDFFSQVRNQPGRPKGLVRVQP
jgi:uncharacterized protein DUF6932